MAYQRRPSGLWVQGPEARARYVGRRTSGSWGGGGRGGVVSIVDPFGTFHNPDNLFPAATFRPYAATAWINLLLGANPTVDPNSATYVATMVSWATTTGAWTQSFAQDKQVGTGFNDYEHVMVFSKPSDPIYTYNPVSGNSYTASFALRGTSFHLPPGAHPALGTDEHFTVIDQATGTEYDFWKCDSTTNASGTAGINDAARTVGGYAIGIFPFWDVTNHVGIGDARLIGGPGGSRGDGANAAITGLWSGNLRATELAAGLIQHPLSVNAHLCSSSIGPVFPAQGNGSTGAGWGPMGQFFQLTLSDAQIAAQSLPDFIKTILYAMAHYGFFVDDTGAGGGGTHCAWDFHFESPQSYLPWSLPDPFVTFFSTRVDGTYVTGSGTSYTVHFSALDSVLVGGVPLFQNIRAISPTYIQSGR